MSRPLPCSHVFLAPYRLKPNGRTLVSVRCAMVGSHAHLFFSPLLSLPPVLPGGGGFGGAVWALPRRAAPNPSLSSSSAQRGLRVRRLAVDPAGDRSALILALDLPSWHRQARQPAEFLGLHPSTASKCAGRHPAEPVGQRVSCLRLHRSTQPGDRLSQRLSVGDTLARLILLQQFALPERSALTSCA